MIHLSSKENLCIIRTIESTYTYFRKENSLKQRVNLKEVKGTYVYKACKYCNLNNKNTNNLKLE